MTCDEKNGTVTDVSQLFLRYGLDIYSQRVTDGALTNSQRVNYISDVEAIWRGHSMTTLSELEQRVMGAPTDLDTELAFRDFCRAADEVISRPAGGFQDALEKAKVAITVTTETPDGLLPGEMPGANIGDRAVAAALRAVVAAFKN